MNYKQIGLILGIAALVGIGVWLSLKTLNSRMPDVPQGGVAIATRFQGEFKKALEEVEVAEKIIIMKDPPLKQIILTSMREKGLQESEFGKTWRFDRDCLCLLPKVPAPVTPQPSAIPVPTNPTTQIKPSEQ